jgi:hypothetical protein
MGQAHSPCEFAQQGTGTHDDVPPVVGDDRDLSCDCKRKRKPSVRKAPLSARHGPSRAAGSGGKGAESKRGHRARAIHSIWAIHTGKRGHALSTSGCSSFAIFLAPTRPQTLKPSRCSAIGDCSASGARLRQATATDAKRYPRSTTVTAKVA